MQIVADALSHIEIGSPVTSGNLTMFPLLNDNEGEPDYLTLDEAFARGIAVVTEISKSGSVPELRFVNNGELPVLLMDGEELIGAKQKSNPEPDYSGGGSRRVEDTGFVRRARAVELQIGGVCGGPSCAVRWRSGQEDVRGVVVIAGKRPQGR
jgi:ARG and Rhodanese-Phosphatase-superfamily-associated Protein domain